MLPQLAVNLGWLRLMGEVLVEQTLRQAPAAEKAAIEKAKRREVRKAHRRGPGGLLVHIATAA